ncbi:hypothetical protein J6590_098363, partial [Homalodisca vitripennis]
MPRHRPYKKWRRLLSTRVDTVTTSTNGDKAFCLVSTVERNIDLLSYGTDNLPTLSFRILYCVLEQPVLEYTVVAIILIILSAPVNLEARSLSGWSTSRHCVVARLQDISAEHFREIRSKAGALLVVLPKDIETLPQSEKQILMDLEKVMLSQEVFIPVYFATWTPELQDIVDDVANSMVTDEKAGTAAQALLNSVSANGYQIVINTNKAVPKTDVHIASIQGKLIGHGVEDKMPTIAIVAHYDSFGVAPLNILLLDGSSSHATYRRVALPRILLQWEWQLLLIGQTLSSGRGPAPFTKSLTGAPVKASSQLLKARNIIQAPQGCPRVCRAIRRFKVHAITVACGRRAE